MPHNHPSRLDDDADADAAADASELEAAAYDELLAAAGLDGDAAGAGAQGADRAGPSRRPDFSSPAAAAVARGRGEGSIPVSDRDNHTQEWEIAAQSASALRERDRYHPHPHPRERSRDALDAPPTRAHAFDSATNAPPHASFASGSGRNQQQHARVHAPAQAQTQAHSSASASASRLASARARDKDEDDVYGYDNHDEHLNANGSGQALRDAHPHPHSHLQDDDTRSSPQTGPSGAGAASGVGADGYGHGYDGEDGSEDEPAYLVRGKFDFVSADPSALQFRAGDVIEVISMLENGWWDGLLGNRRGWFPSNYIEDWHPGMDEEGEGVGGWAREELVQEDEEGWPGDQRVRGQAQAQAQAQVQGQHRLPAGPQSGGAGFNDDNIDGPRRSIYAEDTLRMGDGRGRETWGVDQFARDMGLALPSASASASALGALGAGSRASRGSDGDGGSGLDDFAVAARVAQARAGPSMSMEDTVGGLGRDAAGHHEDVPGLTSGALGASAGRGGADEAYADELGDADDFGAGLQNTLNRRERARETTGETIRSGRPAPGQSQGEGKDDTPRAKGRARADEWVPCLTPEGEVYYHNSFTGADSWEMPVDATNPEDEEEREGDDSLPTPSSLTGGSGTNDISPAFSQGASVPSDAPEDEGAGGADGFRVPPTMKGELPHPWVARLDDKGIKWTYVNRVTGETRDEPPETGPGDGPAKPGAELSSASGLGSGSGSDGEDGKVVYSARKVATWLEQSRATIAERFPPAVAETLSTLLEAVNEALREVLDAAVIGSTAEEEMSRAADLRSAAALAEAVQREDAAADMLVSSHRVVVGAVRDLLRAFGYVGPIDRLYGMPRPAWTGDMTTLIGTMGVFSANVHAASTSKRAAASIGLDDVISGALPQSSWQDVSRSAYRLRDVVSKFPEMLGGTGGAADPDKAGRALSAWIGADSAGDLCGGRWGFGAHSEGDANTTLSPDVRRGRQLDSGMVQEAKHVQGEYAAAMRREKDGRDPLDPLEMLRIVGRFRVAFHGVDIAAVIDLDGEPSGPSAARDDDLRAYADFVEQGRNALRDFDAAVRLVDELAAELYLARCGKAPDAEVQAKITGLGEAVSATSRHLGAVLALTAEQASLVDSTPIRGKIGERSPRFAVLEAERLKERQRERERERDRDRARPVSMSSQASRASRTSRSSRISKGSRSSALDAMRNRVRGIEDDFQDAEDLASEGSGGDAYANAYARGNGNGNGKGGYARGSASGAGGLGLPRSASGNALAAGAGGHSQTSLGLGGRSGAGGGGGAGGAQSSKNASATSSTTSLAYAQQQQHQQAHPHQHPHQQGGAGFGLGYGHPHTYSQGGLHAFGSSGQGQGQGHGPGHQHQQSVSQRTESDSGSLRGNRTSFMKSFMRGRSDSDADASRAQQRTKSKKLAKLLGEDVLASPFVPASSLALANATGNGPGSGSMAGANASGSVAGVGAGGSLISPSTRGAFSPAYTSASASRSLAEVPRYLAEDYEPDEVVLDDKGGVKAGTVRALVVRLTRHGTADTAFAQAFLLTFRSFMTGDELFSHLLDRYHIAPPGDLTEMEMEDWVKAKQTPIRLRVANCIKQWLDSHFLMSEDTPLLPRFEDFASVTLPADNFRALGNMLMNVIGRRARGEEPHQRRIISGGVLSPPAPFQPRLHGKPLTLLEINPIELARQLTIFEFQYFQRIRVTECLDKAWQSDNHARAVNVRATIHTSNKIAAYVTLTILQPKDAKGRGDVIRHWLAVYQECKNLNNFSTVASLCAGVSSSPISRLKRTLETLTGKSLLLKRELDGFMDSTKNFSSYKDLLKAVNPPCVPFLGVYLTALTFIEDGNKSTWQGVSSSGSGLTPSNSMSSLNGNSGGAGQGGIGLGLGAGQSSGAGRAPSALTPVNPVAGPSSAGASASAGAGFGSGPNGRPAQRASQPDVNTGGGAGEDVAPEKRKVNFFKRSLTAEILRDILQYQSQPYNLAKCRPVWEFLLLGLEQVEAAGDLYDLSLAVEPREKEEEKV